MRLAAFITQNMEAIIAEWEVFAKTLFTPAMKMSSLALRDHVRQIMEAVAKDLSAPQTKHEQSEKSMGRAREHVGSPETAAQTHAVLRAQDGLNINQLAAEYRALRASVLRLWEEAGEPDRSDFQDLIRFNEAIDQALAESIDFFSARLDQSRNLLLGMLGHDMRSPLQAILLTAGSLSKQDTAQELEASVDCLTRCGASIQALLEDLLDFSRANLGVGLNLVTKDIDLAEVAADELQQQRAAHPRQVFDLEMQGDMRGRWDGRRVQQVLRNLLSNASAHGLKGEPIRVALRGDGSDVVMEVSNRGPEIKSADRDRIFEPLIRGDVEDEGGASGGLGLGLYIVREISRAHGGDVEVRSDPQETAFVVRLPRQRGVPSAAT